MYGLVEEYAALGDHRTGTAVDDATRTWLADHLQPLATDIEEIPYEFPQFLVHRCTVRIDGVDVESLPLWYGGDGAYDTREVLRDTPDPSATHTSHHAAYTASSRPGPRVVATPGPTGALVAVNRAPSTAGGDLVVLVPGSCAPRLAGAQVQVTASVEHTTGRSAAVVARLGRPPTPTAPPVVVTTPLSGWFACAGERGTGIAVALGLAAELAADHPVLFVGTTGHEIGYLGVDRLVASHGFDDPAAIVHLGASIAAGTVADGVGTLSPRRLVLSSRTTAEAPGLDAIAAEHGLGFHHDPDDWLGEGEILRRLRAPLLSFLGTFDRFHTAQDTPERSTTPAMLAASSDAVRRAVRAFLGSPR